MVKQLLIVSICCWMSASANGQTRTISGDAGWRMFSIPKTGATVSDISDDTAIQGVTGGSDSDKAANIYYNAASDGSNGWAIPTNMSTAWGDGLGVIVYFYDNTTGGSSELPLDLDVSGSEPGSDVNVTISNDFTLLGNPFQSNINLDDIDGNASGAGILFGGIKSSVKVWSDASSSYLSYNLGTSQVLSAWQGFFIEKASGLLTDLTNVKIPTTAKTGSAADIEVYSKKNTFDYRSMDLHVKGEGYNDLSSKFFFTAYSNEDEDQFDGTKLNPINGSPNIAFIRNSGEEMLRLSQDARALNPDVIQEYILDFNDMGISGDFELSWPNWTNIPDEWTITLTDTELDIEIDMREESLYSFTIASKQKRSAQTVLQVPALKAKASGDEYRFKVDITPGITVGLENEFARIEQFELEQNYPNPFNPSTTIRYSVAENGPVNISIYNITGQKVAELVNTTKAAGSHQIAWNATALSSGIYYYRLTAPGQVLTKQMTLIK